MNRINKKFKELKAQKKKAFVAFITAGDPSLAMTEKHVLSLAQSGVDIIELGVTFSDPMADGPTIQAASQRALKAGTDLNGILNVVKRIRKTCDIPIALMTYYNPVFHFGDAKLVTQAKKAGVDGLIIPDLPPEEAADLISAARKEDVATVFFISSTTRSVRHRLIIKHATGFIYYLSLSGVTGARTALPRNIKKNVEQVKTLTAIPVCVGFGISQPQQVKEIARFADGVIVGSAIVKKIAQAGKGAGAVKQVSNFVKTLTKELR